MLLCAMIAVKMGKKITWDPVGMKVPSKPKANALIKATCRPGLTIA